MKKFIIISGVSGAGKTFISNVLEDKGYRCIDQYPIELLDNLIELIKKDDSIKYQNIALTIPIVDFEKYEPLIRNSDLKPILILLDADKDTVINRYKFTRRIHPLLVNNVAGTLEEAIELERSLVKKYSGKGVYVINTTNSTQKVAREQLDKALNNEPEADLSLSFVSFGFKNGVPKDADVVFDVRFLDNPFYDPKLKKKTGNDKPVKEFVMNKKMTQTYLKKLSSYMDFMLKSYSKGDRRHLTICVGCTGGQHRSVVVANYLYSLYKDKYVCYIKHREIEK